jgi:predicted enzyme related to lactoylglutathione lyase
MLFGSQIRRRGDGSAAFVDGVGEVSGAWVTGRPPSGQSDLLVYILVGDEAATIATIIAHGGEMVQAVGANAPEITARCCDPGGNILGLYQEPAPRAARP